MSGLLVAPALCIAVLSAQTGPITPEDRAQAQEQAKSFFAHIMIADPRGLAEMAAVPFFLEDRKIASREELASEWSRSLKGKRTDLLKLYNIEIFSPAEMERTYGKPPPRLKTLPWKAPRTLIAVANLSGHAAIALLTRTEDGWQVSGFTD